VFAVGRGAAGPIRPFCLIAYISNLVAKGASIGSLWKPMKQTQFFIL